MEESCVTDSDAAEGSVDRTGYWIMLTLKNTGEAYLSRC